MKELKLLCIVSLCVTLLLLGEAKAETLFFDDFEDGMGKWPEMPTLAIDVDPENPNNHVLAFDTTNDTTNVDALFLEGFEDLTDYTVRAKINVVGETASYAVAGFILRAQSTTEYMLIEPANNRQGVAEILNVFERAGGQWPIVADGQIDFKMNKWYELSVTVKADILTVYIDEKKVAEYNKVAFPKGGFGIRQWQAKALIDDFEMYDADGSSMQVEPRGKLAATWGRLKTNDPLQ